MQSRTTILLATLLIGTACARQVPNELLDDYEDNMSEGGSGGSGGSGKAGSGTMLGTSGTVTMPSAGKGSGGGTPLPTPGSGGKTGSGGKSSGGTGGTGGAGGSSGGMGSGGSEPVNMPVVGLNVTYKAESSTDPNDFIGGELDLINDTAQPFTLSELKIRYYFSNEILGAIPTVMMNWAQFGPQNNLGGATCTGTIAPVAAPKPGADDYVELTCTGQTSTELSAGTMLKASWKAGAQGQGKFTVTDDWSFSDPSKIVVLNGNTIIWGVAP